MSSNTRLVLIYPDPFWCAGSKARTPMPSAFSIRVVLLLSLAYQRKQLSRVKSSAPPRDKLLQDGPRGKADELYIAGVCHYTHPSTNYTPSSDNTLQLI